MISYIALIIHVFWLMFMLSIPFLPLNIIKRYYLYMVPLLIHILWEIFDGCPISKFHVQGEKYNFVHSLLKQVFPKISEEKTNQMIEWHLIIMMIIIIYRLFQKCRI